MSRASKATYVNTLEKGLIQYYFEIFASNNEAYIEKTDLSKRDSHESGWFTIEEARRCWKALTAKGFVKADEEESKGSSTVYVVQIVSSGGVRNDYTVFETEDEATWFCERQHWVHLDHNKFEWNLEIVERPASEYQMPASR